MNSAFESLVRFIIDETIRHRVFVVFGFVSLTLAVLFIGANWPKVYTSSTSIYVEEQNIIGPLMQGAAVQTAVADRSGIAREIIYGRKILLKVLKELGLDESASTPAEIERMMEDIKRRTTVTGRLNLITIEYRDSDPQTAYAVTKYLADFFIAESLADKARESQAAFEFIDHQAQEYKAKLINSEEELKQFRSENVEARPGIVGDVGRRNTELTAQLEQISQELREERIRRASLARQLSGEAASASSFTRTERNRARIAELQSQLDTLRLSYHDTYPDVIQLKAQIQDLRNAISRDSAGDGAGALDESVLANPLYQELQRAVYESNIRIETLQARYEQTQAALNEQLNVGKRVEDYQARYAELTRDYEVNREIYADLTRRRESARVSMNMDREQKGLTMRVDEPAYLPHEPSGPRFLHFMIAGPLMGLLLPVGIVVVFRKLDPRIRSEDRITEELGLPVLGVLPHIYMPAEAKREALGTIALSLFLVGGLVSMAAIVIQRIAGAG